MSKIEQLRNKLHEAIDKYGIDAEETRRISVELDKRLNECVYNEKNLMYNKYLESMFELRKISKIFGKFPTIDEWNKYAKENMLLNSESIKYISGLNWHKLKDRIKNDLNKKI